MTNVGVARVRPDGLQREGKELVEKAREDGDIDQEDFGLLFTATTFNFRRLVKGLEQEIDSEWMGGTTVGEIHPEGPSDGTAVLMLVESNEIEFDTVKSKKVSGNAEEAAASAVRRLNAITDTDRNELLYTLIPGLTLEKEGREFKFLKGLEKNLTRDMKIVGGSTGDGHKLKENYQFKNGEIYADRAVMVVIKTELEIKSGQAHGFDQEVATGVVNEAEGRWLKKINGRPALDWYSDKTGVPKNELSKIYDLPLYELMKVGIYYLMLKIHAKDPSIIHRILQHSLDYSLATEMKPGEYRIISPILAKDGEIKLFDEVKKGQNIKILKADEESVLKAPKEAFKDSNPEDVVFGVFADCANRHMLLDEDQREKEVETAVEALGDKIIGFYGEGEIGDGTGICTYMNQTITGFALERPD